MQERGAEDDTRDERAADRVGADDGTRAAERASDVVSPAADAATDGSTGGTGGAPTNAPADAAPPDPEADLRAREARLRAYARLLDSAVRLPGGFRIGLDGLIGLVPGVGDIVGAGLSGYLVVAAARLGVSRTVLARMIANVVIESVVGAVPIVGDAFDFVFKANERNVRLLHRELERREAERGSAAERDGRDEP